MLASMCACGSANSGAASSASGTASVSSGTGSSQSSETVSSSSSAGTASSSGTASSAGTAQSGASAGKSAADFTAILTAISTGYEDGTAGSSLKAAKFAGELLDWNADAKMSADDIKSAASGFYSALGKDAAKAFPGQLDSIYSAANDLCGKDGKELLDESGYAAKSYPWSADDMTALFGAIYAGCGLDVPQNG